MRRTMKKTFLWILVVAMLVSIVASFTLAGCTAPAAPTQEAAADETEFYNFVNDFSTGCRNHGLFINENAASVKLKDAYQKYGDSSMRKCFNVIIDKALRKKQRGEKIHDLITYGLQVIHNEFNKNGDH